MCIKTKDYEMFEHSNIMIQMYEKKRFNISMFVDAQVFKIMDTQHKYIHQV